MKAIKKEDLAGFVDNLIGHYEVFGPVPREFKHAFDRIASFSELALDYKTTLLPPKKYLLPQKETLIKFTIGDEPVVEPVLEIPNRVVFGVHSCDLHGVWLLDDIFAEGSMDVNYASRRQARSS
jgi:sulfhydrogenase subunit beta (sulfur reductase)